MTLPDAVYDELARIIAEIAQGRARESEAQPAKAGSKEATA